MNDLYLVSPIPVSVNEYLKPHMIHKGRGMVVMYETAAAKAYKAAFIPYIQEEAKKQNFQKIENTSQHCYVDVGIYFPRKRMDANNHWKIMLDAITESKAVWMDDSQVCERVKFIRYDSKNPRIELHIHPVDYIGIFDTQKEFDTFSSRCKSCNRYLDGRCSILVESCEGRIKEDVVNRECQKYKQRSS
nr:MAG TPA: Endodeoxyribonuclease RusA [Caudoviricetes sp.]